MANLSWGINPVGSDNVTAEAELIVHREAHRAADEAAWDAAEEAVEEAGMGDNPFAVEADYYMRCSRDCFIDEPGAQVYALRAGAAASLAIAYETRRSRATKDRIT